MPVESVRFVKELYPRLREDDTAVERYRAAVDLLPPIVVARDGVLVDGFHRWQAHRKEGRTEIAAENLGNLSDVEIIKESVRRNASHGRQLETKDKRRMADLLYRQGTRDPDELVGLLAVTANTLTEYLRDARRDEKQARKELVWSRWLDCLSYREIETETGVDAATAQRWCVSLSNDLGNGTPESRQHFDVWQFQTAEGESSYFGKMPPQVMENLLWLYTEPGGIVFDPFVGGGTTIDVAKRMGRRVWSSDRKPSTPTLPIHEHDILTGWPAAAPAKADLVLLDPPYWQQAKGRYSDDADDLGNMDLDGFYTAWAAAVKTCAAHLTEGGRLAYIISPTQREDGGVEDHATAMLRACWDEGLQVERRIIVPYNTQQATGQQVTWARDGKRLLKLYRDLVVLSR